MRKVALSLALAVLAVFAFGLAAHALDPTVPTVSAIAPTSGFNDIDTRITITGADFAVETSADVVTALPTVALGTTQLTDVTWVDTQTLVASIPWGMDAGTYDLAVTNPGGGTFSQPAAFTVSQGINTWNAGELNGASVRELRMKPGDPNTLYALAYDVGVFRSRDAGASWTYTSASVIGNSVFTVDPFHPSWLYSYMNAGLWVSKDEGDSWTNLIDSSDAITSAEVFVSPHTSGTLFVGYYGAVTPASYRGLVKSTNDGSTWTRIQPFDGMSVQSVAFDPTPGSHAMVLATSDARVFKSPDEGATWSEVLKPPLSVGIGMYGYVKYNPYRPDEVWISSAERDAGMFKTTISSVTTWTEVPLGNMGYPVTFAGPNDVYTWCAQSHDGGSTWTPFGPWPTWGDGEVLFGLKPGGTVDTETVYITCGNVGIHKSTTGGVTGPSGEASWTVANQGLAGMRCVQMAVSRTDPLHVWATFGEWDGIFESTDGTTHWTFTEVPGSGQMSQVVEDPFHDGWLYASGDRGFYRSLDSGATWDGDDWGSLLPAGTEQGLMNPLAADPHQPGHLLVGCRGGMSSTHDHDKGFLFSSTDYGATWQSIAVIKPIESLAYISDIVFDPETTGTVYVSTGGTGLYRSTTIEDATPSWSRIDDRSQAYMANEDGFAIATHPRRVLFVSGDSGRPFRSFDEGATWENKAGGGDTSARHYVFVDGDSSRLYSPDWTGLHFSGSVGDSWTNASGALGTVQNTTLAYAHADGHTLLYVATTGGKTGLVVAQATAISRPASRLSHPALSAEAADAAAAAAPPANLVGAGIYRRAQVSVNGVFTSTASRDGWVVESSRTSSHGGSTSSGATTIRMGDDASRRQYRSVLSFSTAGIPDTAVITGVTLKVRKQGVTGGGDPVSKFGGFVADLKKGYFGTGTSLRAADFQASASKSTGASKTALVDGWYSIDLNSAKAYVNKTATGSGLTQIRLRFKTGDNNNRVANYLRLYSGDASAGSRPRLVVTYYLP